MRNDPAQQAGFRVLKTAHFPSVLIELAYVTNKEDAALLQSDAWREKVAGLDHDGGRQLLQQPDRAHADVTPCAQGDAPKIMKAGREDRPFFMWPARGRTPCRLGLI